VYYLDIAQIKDILFDNFALSNGIKIFYILYTKIFWCYHE